MVARALSRDKRKQNVMSKESRRLAGILLVILPTVIYGGAMILKLLIIDLRYAQNRLRQDLWGAGHARAGVLLVLSLIVLRYVDEDNLWEASKWIVRYFIPLAAIFLPAAFFLCVSSPTATEPNGFIYFAYLGAVVLAVGLVLLGIGLVRKSKGT
jgi:hypothetical protein